ncbi:DUF397 domain-containing protein [Streptomyces sp. PT12]|uniref:DUF397 domain-containing protein n=1 Tax=Streptomyces sp. PT12 TaxID=1510197 RepID=UPI000DE52306|nr:DUF397 domain-containing protein [Streptomyces sp. PT12]RBM23608.1 DUF397 domain-containing protein [Streptomyces sp. PT12]
MRELDGANWRRSSYSSGNGECVEVADGIIGVVPVRDSKTVGGPLLAVPANGWATFIDAVKGGEFSK